MPTKLNTEILTAAIEGFEAQKARIDAQIADLRAMLSGGPARATATPEAPTRKRKKFSAASRRKMAMAQRARWAAIKGTSPATSKPAKPKRRISEEGMKRIVAATKKRWALKRAEGAKTAKKAAPARKKAAVKKSASKSAAAWS
jgi:hypothetical protein